MKTFEQLLSEMERFKDSSEFSKHMYSLYKMLKDPKMQEWAKDTDNNNYVNAVGKYNAILKAFEDFIKELEKTD